MDFLRTCSKDNKVKKGKSLWLIIIANVKTANMWTQQRKAAIGGTANITAGMLTPTKSMNVSNIKKDKASFREPF